MTKDQDYLSMTISAESVETIVRAINDLVPSIPKEQRIPFNTIKLDLLSRFGEQGLFDRCNNRTIGSVLSEYATPSSIVVAEGELEGKRYILTDSNDDST
jgi:hypothetical protein